MRTPHQFGPDAPSQLGFELRAIGMPVCTYAWGRCMAKCPQTPTHNGGGYDTMSNPGTPCTRSGVASND